MSDPAVLVEDLTVRIKKKTILRDLFLRVEEGSFHGIIGPNGAGKTTLFNAIQGFRRATMGTISVLGESPIPRNTRLLARIGIQPQQSAFFPKTTLREHLGAVTDIHGAPRSRVDELIDALNLAYAADTKVEGLSGGERQRLAVATALVHKPQILFLDEPTAGLDPEARRSLVSLLQSSEVVGMTTLYTTHYLDEAERLCDTVSIVDDGRIVETASPSRLIADAHLGATILLPAALHQADLISGVCGEGNVRVSSDGVEVRGQDTAQLFTQLSGHSVDTRNAQVHNGRLEDVYLELTGKDFVA